MNTPLMSKVQKVQREVDEVQHIVVENINKLVERGERVDVLVEKSENLSVEARQFKKKTVLLKQRMWCQNAKLTMVLVCIAVTIVAVVIAAVCATGNCRR